MKHSAKVASVPSATGGHSANRPSLPSACPRALGKALVTLPSVMAIALGKVTENSLFYLFFTSHPNKQKIYI